MLIYFKISTLIYSSPFSIQMVDWLVLTFYSLMTYLRLRELYL